MIGKVEMNDNEGKGRFSSLEFIAARKRIRANKKSALKVQLCHAMDQMVFDVKQAIELKGREAVGVRPAAD